MHPIKEARLKAGLSRPQMSKLFDVSVRVIENWEYYYNAPPKWAEQLILDKLERIIEIKENEKNSLENLNIKVLKGANNILEQAAAFRDMSVDDYVKSALKTQYKADTGEDIEL